MEFGRARREAEARVASLAPRLMALAEMERAGRGAGVSSGVAERRVWERFAVASAGLEGDPLSAIEELRSLADILDELSVEFGGIEAPPEFGSEMPEGVFIERSGDDGAA